MVMLVVMVADDDELLEQRIEKRVKREKEKRKRDES
jgi:hypothetical protein